MLIGKRKVDEKRVVNRQDELVEICRGQKVLHLGCADYPFSNRPDLLHKRLSEVCDCWGLDVSKDGVEYLESLGYENLFVGSTEDIPEKLREQKFDLVIAGEIIEHLGNPERFLQEIEPFLRNGAKLLLTTINAFAFKIWVWTLFGKDKGSSKSKNKA